MRKFLSYCILFSVIFSEKIVHAVRIEEPIYIDGMLTENVWYGADFRSDFEQFKPDNGAEPSEGTMFMVLYDDENLYVGVYVMEKEQQSIMGKLRRRDDFALADYIFLGINTEKNGKNAYSFGVNPSGVKYDSFISNDDEEDYTWDGVWDVKVVRDYENQDFELFQRRVGWTAEFRIPFSAMRFDANKTDEWRFNVHRFKGATLEQNWWANKKISEPGQVSHYGKLKGLSGLKPAGNLEILPGGVITADSKTLNFENPLIGDLGFHYSLSGNLRYNLSTKTRLECAVNPDFGQAELDPSELNLSVYETYFPEKRSFFVNGAEIFTTPYEMFYSRRIGKATGDGFAPIIGAGKLTGKTGNTTYGVITAFTDSSGYFGKTGFLIGRGKHTLNNGNTNLGVIFTGQHEKNSDESPLTFGLDWDHQFFADQLVFSGQFAQSLSGDLAGYGITTDISQIGGQHWNFNFGIDLRTEDFDLNALGFLNRSNITSYYMQQSFFTSEPMGKFQEMYGSLSIWNQQNFSDRMKLSSGIAMSTNLTLLNQWSTGATISYKTAGYDDLDSRGGAIIFDPATTSISSWLANKPTQKQNQQFSVFYGGDEYSSNWFGASYRLELTPAEHYSISVAPDFVWNYDESQWVDNLYTYPEIDFLGSVYGKLLSHTYSLTMRSNYSFTPDMSLQIFAQPFLAMGRYDSYRFFTKEMTYQFDDDFQFYGNGLNENNTWYTIDDPGYGESYQNHDYNFNIKSVNWQSVYRWEFRPGSIFFLIWSFSSAENETYLGKFDLTGSLAELFSQRPYHKFLVKFNYWIKY